MKPIWIIGAGGLAKVVIDTLRASRSGEIAGVLDDDPGRWGTEVLGVPVIGDVSIESLARLGIERAVIAIGSNRVRAQVAQRLSERLDWAITVHPMAYLGQGVRLGKGAIVFAGAVIQPDVTVGSHTIVNVGSSISHDSIVSDFVHVGPGARVAGGVRVGYGALLGVASCVIPGRSVGAWATIGAGGVVTRDIPDGVTAKGVPARFESP